MSKHILITGATGYIGQRLAVRLAEEGNIVHVLCRTEANIPDHSNIRIYKGDINDKKSLINAADSCEEVYHMAGFARVWAKDPLMYERINVEGTQNVLDAAREVGIRKTVFTSTAGVLGPSEERPVAEDDPRSIGFFNEYEETKSRAEARIRERVQAGEHIVIVNPPRVYGPGLMSESNAVTRLIDLYLKGKWRIMPGDGTKTGSYVYVDDVVSGHILAMERGRPGERYILGGANASYIDFFDTLAEVSGVRNKLIKVPVPAMTAFAGFQLLRTKFTGKAPLITPKWVRKYLYAWSLSSEKAQRELGYTYRSLEEGIRLTVESLRSKR